MRLSSTNNCFILNFPQDFIKKYLVQQFDKLMEKNFIPYDSVIDYINSTIKDVVFPGSTYETSEQIKKYSKKISYKEAGNIFDKFNREVDITFRSVDSWLNYFILLQVCIDFYEDNFTHQIPMILLQILDKDGDLIYTVRFREVIFKSMGEIRLGYNAFEIQEQLFSLTFTFNWLDIFWELDDTGIKNSQLIYDIPIKWTPAPLDIEFSNFPYPYQVGNTIPGIKNY